MKIKTMIMGLVFLLLTSSLYAAAPTFVTTSNLTGDATVDSQWTGGWNTVDSIYLTIDDTSYTILTISGVAIMNPGDALYIGFGNDSANRVSGADVTANSNLDTALIIMPLQVHGTQKVPFCIRYTYLYESQTDIEDTFYFNAASRGSESWDQVQLEDVVVSGEVGDYNAGFN